MKNVHLVFLGVILGSLLITFPAGAQDASNAELNERVRNLEERLDPSKNEQRWTDRISISGAIEAEAGYAQINYDDPNTDDVDESDIVLATVELGVDAQIHDHISGHVLLLWGEDDTDPLDVDEGFITFDGKDKLPMYLKAGKFYLPFGNFESHMITDPVTLELGETNQSAVQVGFVNHWIDGSIAIFNGDVNERGEDEAIDSFAAGIQISPPEGTIANVGLTAGMSYISNMADSDALGEEIVDPDGEIESHVAALSVFINVSFAETFFLKTEYTTALDAFEAGDLTITAGSEIEPSALNIEFAYVPLENLEVAVRYAQTDDVNGGVFPESQYGISAAYGLFESTTVAVEYLKNDYENNDDASVITTQLAIEF